MDLLRHIYHFISRTIFLWRTTIRNVFKCFFSFEILEMSPRYGFKPLVTILKGLSVKFKICNSSIRVSLEDQR